MDSSSPIRGDRCLVNTSSRSEPAKLVVDTSGAYCHPRPPEARSTRPCRRTGRRKPNRQNGGSSSSILDAGGAGGAGAGGVAGRVTGAALTRIAGTLLPSNSTSTANNATLCPGQSSMFCSSKSLGDPARVRLVHDKSFRFPAEVQDGLELFIATDELLLETVDHDGDDGAAQVSGAETPRRKRLIDLHGVTPIAISPRAPDASGASGNCREQRLTGCGRLFRAAER